MIKKPFITTLLFLLSGIVNMLSAQSNNTTDSLSHVIPEQTSVNMSSGLLGCVNSYADQTVSYTTSISGCSTLSVQNITVTSSGNLTLKAPEAITLSPTFLAQKGAILYIGIEKFQRKKIIYDYDASGNRIVRSLD